MWEKKDRYSLPNFGMDGQGYPQSGLGKSLVFHGELGFRRRTRTETFVTYNTNFPTPYSGVWCCLGSLSSHSPHLEKKPHRYLVILKVENQGLLSSISFSLVLFLLSKPLDAKPKSWLHPMFPSEETALVIENRNQFFYSNSWDAGKIPVCAPPWLCLF